MIDIPAYINFVILLVFSIVGNIFLLKESKESRNITSGIKKLKWIAIINVVFLGINFFFPPIITTNEITTLYTFLVPICLIDVPFLVGYGILMYLFGKKVVQDWGNYLKIAGLIGIVGNSFLFPLHIISLITLEIPSFFYMITMILSTIGGISWLAEYILIYVNGKKNKKTNFTISGLFLGIGFILYFLLGIILNIVFPNQI